MSSFEVLVLGSVMAYVGGHILQMLWQWDHLLRVTDPGEEIQRPVVRRGPRSRLFDHATQYRSGEQTTVNITELQRQVMAGLDPDATVVLTAEVREVAR